MTPACATTTRLARRLQYRPAPAQTRPWPAPTATSPTSFSTCSARRRQHDDQTDREKGHQQNRQDPFWSRLRAALAATRVQWRPIPVGLGIGFLGLWQVYRIERREAGREGGPGDSDGEHDGDGQQRPAKRKRPKPSGPWQVQVMSTLPLKAMSRLWGRFNELDIPYYLRVPGFRLYSWIFGARLDEIEEPDLHNFPNLASFFYRTLKPGVRPLDPDLNAVLSPADGRVVQFGTIEPGGELEQVKGVTYSLEALLGRQGPAPADASAATAASPQSAPSDPDAAHIKSDEEFANVNGISYTLPNLFSGPQAQGAGKLTPATDQSTAPRADSESAVQQAMADDRPWWAPAPQKTPTALYYLVVYLAPGDYHRFHSPVSWVVSSRRHFAGELYSVSPYLVRTLPGLFTLNERVVLLGRWKHGFFSYTPVGATNVGSIVVNFDRELRTNSLTTDTAADRAADEAQRRGQAYSGYAEASYAASSAVLGGHALARGQEMGGFRLGSTIVLVFEAPKGRRPSLDAGFDSSAPHGGRLGQQWAWSVRVGDAVRVGQAVGRVVDGDEPSGGEAQ